MRFTLAQLKKLKFPYSYDETMDLSEDLNGLEDIIEASPCNIHSIIKDRGDGSYKISFNIKIDLTIEDSINLKHLKFPIDIDAEEIFSTDDSNDDAFLIDGITLDTKEAIITNILINKPMATSDDEFQDEIDEEEEKINPAFASLKDLL